MMSARTVHVTVLHFLRGGIAHINNGHVEIQCLPGQRMIAVYGYAVGADCGDHERPGAAVATTRKTRLTTSVPTRL